MDNKIKEACDYFAGTDAVSTPVMHGKVLASAIAADPLDAVTLSKIDTLREQGMRQVGVVMIDDSGKRATVDMGRVTWSDPTSKATEKSWLSEIQDQLTRMLSSAAVLTDAEYVTGYQIKTGALHSILGTMQGAGFPVDIPLPQNPVASSKAGAVRNAAPTEAYEMLDRYLRNNMDDHDYAEYSNALELLYAATPSPIKAEPKKNEQVFPVDIFGSPMREYAPGKWENGYWPSDAVPSDTVACVPRFRPPQSPDFNAWIESYRPGKPYWSSARVEICWDAWLAGRSLPPQGEAQAIQSDKSIPALFASLEETIIGGSPELKEQVILAARSLLASAVPEGDADEPFCWWRLERDITDEYSAQYSEDGMKPKGSDWKPLFDRPAAIAPQGGEAKAVGYIDANAAKFLQHGHLLFATLHGDPHHFAEPVALYTAQALPVADTASADAIPTWQEQDKKGGIEVPGTVYELMQAEIDALRAALQQTQGSGA